MTDEKEIIKATAEGSNAASIRSRFRTMIEEEKDSEEEVFNFEYDSDISSEYLSDSSEEE